MSYFYNVSGVVIRSEIHLKYLKNVEEQNTYHLDVSLGKAEFKGTQKDEVTVARLGGYPIACTSQHFFMKIFNVALFSIESRAIVKIELLENSTLEKALPFFYGTVLTMMLHMQKLFPMHASAVLSKKGINIFCAESGTGKSTLAFNLFNRGFPLFSDDKCIFKWDKLLKKYTSTPSIRAVRLWQNSIDGSIDSSVLEDGIPVIHNKDKFQFNLDKEMYDRVQMLNQMFVIRKSEKTKEVKIRPLDLQERQAAIRNQIHRPKLIFGEDIKAKFERYVKNFSQLVPIYFVIRPEDIPIQEFVDFMEQQIKSD